jgi:hypothetical protein
MENIEKFSIEKIRNNREMTVLLFLTLIKGQNVKLTLLAKIVSDFHTFIRKKRIFGKNSGT